MRNIFLSVIVSLLIIQSAFAQLDLKRDDFVNTTNRNWWKWHNDGPSTPVPSVNDGYVLFSLVDPVADFDPYCDAALWDGYPELGGPYGSVQITARVRAMNPHKYGSRGWGLWYTEPFPNLQQQAWYMRVLDDTIYTGLDWWRAETSNGRTEATHHYTDLDQDPFIIDDELWHIYYIDRQPGYILFKIDGDTVLYVTQDVPQTDMAFHIWVDNLVYEHVPPDTIKVHRREWIGKNDIVMDYVQIVTAGQLDQSESPFQILRLRQVPNEIYTDTTAGLWKSYSFSSPDGPHIVLATARVEQYLDANQQPISDDDDIRFVIDGTDYGWDTSTSFNADAQGTTAKTMLFNQVMGAGAKNIMVYGETSPLLYDVTVIGSNQGGVVFDQEYNETKLSGSAELWKEITFNTNGGWVVVYVSATADEDSSPANYGYQYSSFDDSADDDLKLVLDNTDYGYKTAQSFYGNRLFGEPKSVVIQDSLTAGQHTLQLYGTGTPTLYRVVIFGENDIDLSPIDEAPARPIRFSLAQNYPNPFNGTTRLEVGMPVEGSIRLMITNTLGEVVRILHNGRLSAGKHRFFWNGRNEWGKTVASGIYYYHLINDNGLMLSKKMIFIK